MIPEIKTVLVVLYVCFGIGYAKPGFITLTGRWDFSEIISSILAAIAVVLFWPAFLALRLGTYLRVQLTEQ